MTKVLSRIQKAYPYLQWRIGIFDKTELWSRIDMKYATRDTRYRINIRMTRCVGHSFDVKPSCEPMMTLCQWTYFNEILFEIQIFLFKQMHLEISSAKYPPFCVKLITHFSRVDQCLYFPSYFVTITLHYNWHRSNANRELDPLWTQARPMFAL